MRARLRSGNDVAILDISAGGALLESGHRLLPGVRTELHLMTSSTRLALPGCVLRAEVYALACSMVRYRGAFQFTRLDERAAASLATLVRASATREAAGSDGSISPVTAEFGPAADDAAHGIGFGSSPGVCQAPDGGCS